jgi:hypothetical protein
MNWITKMAAILVRDSGLDQFVGHGQEELAEQEGGGGAGDQRDGQARVAVEHAQVGNHLVGGQDAHLHRQHQRHEDQPEHQRAAREAEVHHRKGREQADGDLADGDGQRADQADHHHRRHRRDGAAVLRLPAEQRQAVALEHVVAGHHRHRHVLHDLLGRLRAGDEGDVHREGDDDHAQHQHHVCDERGQGAVLDHQ